MRYRDFVTLTDKPSVDDSLHVAELFVESIVKRLPKQLAAIKPGTFKLIYKEPEEFGGPFGSIADENGNRAEFYTIGMEFETEEAKEDGPSERLVF